MVSSIVQAVLLILDGRVIRWYHLTFVFWYL